MFSTGLLQGMLLHRHTACGLCPEQLSRRQRARDLAVRADGSGETPALAGKPALRPPPPKPAPPSGNGLSNVGAARTQTKQRPDQRASNSRNANRQRRQQEEQPLVGGAGGHANNGAPLQIVSGAWCFVLLARKDTHRF